MAPGLGRETFNDLSGSYLSNALPQVTEGHCWVQGNNQLALGDSGHGLGEIPLSKIEGKMLLRLGLEGWNWIEHQTVPVQYIRKPLSMYKDR